MVDAALLRRITQLPRAERLEVLEAVQASLEDEYATNPQPADVDVTPEERAMLEERLRDATAHPENLMPWPQVHARLEARLGR